MRTDFEHIVVGLGGIGSGAAYWMARRSGDELLGLEQFELGHDRGASQDHSRIIRLSYHTPGYVRLARQAYRAWAELEDDAEENLILKTGGLDLWPANAAIVACQPVAYRTTDDKPDFTSMPEFPFGLDPLQLSRQQMADYAVKARNIGVNFIGSCSARSPGTSARWLARWARCRWRTKRSNGRSTTTNRCPPTSTVTPTDPGSSDRKSN